MEVLRTIWNAFCYCGFAGLLGLGWTLGCAAGKKFINMMESQKHQNNEDIA